MVRALVRSSVRAVMSFGPNASPQELVPGNIHDPASLRTAMQGVDAAIHLVGIIGELSRNTFDRVHMEGTRNVVKAAQDAGVSRFIQMSALGSRPDAVSRYHRSKWAAEEIVRQSGLAFTIFRPSIVYGLDMPNRSLYQLIAVLDKGWFFFIGKPGAIANYVHVENLVDALLLCAMGKLPCNSLKDREIFPPPPRVRPRSLVSRQQRCGAIERGAGHAGDSRCETAARPDRAATGGGE